MRCVMSAVLTRRATDHPFELGDRDPVATVARLGLGAELARGILWGDAARLLNLSDVTRFKRENRPPAPYRQDNCIECDVNSCGLPVSGLWGKASNDKWENDGDRPSGLSNAFVQGADDLQPVVRQERHRRRSGTHWESKPIIIPSFLERCAPLSNLRGALVTMPHKVTTTGLVDELTTTALIAGATNAVLVREDGSVLGDQFDGAGFVRGVQRKGFELAGEQTSGGGQRWGWFGDRSIASAGRRR